MPLSYSLVPHLSKKLTKLLLTLNKHFTWSWLNELEQFTPVVQIKGSVRVSVWTPEVRHETPEEDRRTYQLKRCDHINK